MKTLEILVGIPCSGKSTYCKTKSHDYIGYPYFNVEVISRDSIREDLLNSPYIYSNENENRVTRVYNSDLTRFIEDNTVDTIILDNTHCKEKYINEIFNKYKNICFIKIKFFDIPLWKAHYRNIIRYFKEGKWIPINVMNNMYKNYKQIDKDKYAKYNI